MDKKEEGCCSGEKGGCGPAKCCKCAKLIIGLVILLIGGILGYYLGSCKSYGKMCRMSNMQCPMSQTATPAATPAK
jgi:hypothetical protein